ncbi:MAG TPA: hypothetical protein VIN93_11270 [Bryobacteraceae bacterium]|jgi:hypothetical protein
MPTATIQQYVQILLLLGSALVAAKLYRNGLWRKYPIFFAYFVLRVPNFVWPLMVDTGSPVYLWLFLVTSPVFVIFYVLLVAELYRLILKKYRGMETMGRWVMYTASAASVVLSVLALLPRFTPAMPQRSRDLGYEYALERGIDLSLVVFILLMLLFLSRFPIPLSRNVVVHAAIFTLYFLAAALGLLLHALWGINLSAELSLSLSCVSLLCVGAWLLLLNPAGENVPAHLPLLGSGDEEKILRELDAVNAALLRVSRQV